MWSYWLKGDWVKLSFPEVAQATPDVASVGSGRTTGARRLPPDHGDHVLVIATFVDDRHDLRLPFPGILSRGMLRQGHSTHRHRWDDRWWVTAPNRQFSADGRL